MNQAHPVHHKGSRARILLTSVFGPYARDDGYGSRRINPMELYQNQVTRFQGVFSLRMFHRSFGLLMIRENITNPCTLLDFPDLDQFVREIKENRYDIVGISAIIANIGKVRKMCELVRTHLPEATLVVGGHIANLEGIDQRISADHIVRGDGIRWFRRFLGQNEEARVKHPQVLSASNARILGRNLSQKRGETAAILIPSVGCPMGCNFCSTSALFGGKGKFVNFYETGDELYAVMAELAEGLETQSFFVLDENFLLHRKRALRLLELFKQNNRSWSLYVFSSARVLASYDIEELVALGVSWVWMGLEGEKSRYSKLAGIDTRRLVRRLQSRGIRVLGSTIIGLENHRPENIDSVIDYAVSHDTDFHQFMLYTANAGTPLYEKLKEAGKLLPESEFSLADSHGQFRFNHRHNHIPPHAEEGYLHRAFVRDHEQNGPSLFRLIRTMLQGWQRYRDHADPRLRDRMAREVKPLRSTYAAAVWAMQRWYRGNPVLRGKMAALIGELYRTFGWKTRLIAPVLGSFVFLSMKREESRLRKGMTLEPPTLRLPGKKEVGTGSVLDMAGRLKAYAERAHSGELASCLPANEPTARVKR